MIMNSGVQDAARIRGPEAGLEGSVPTGPLPGAGLGRPVGISGPTAGP